MFSSLDGGDIEKVINQRQQVFATGINILGIFLVLLIPEGAKVFSLENLGKAEDGV